MVSVVRDSGLIRSTATLGGIESINPSPLVIHIWREGVVAVPGKRSFVEIVAGKIQLMMSDPTPPGGAGQPIQLRATRTIAPSQQDELNPSARRLPSHIGRYRIIRLIGEGGMGAVYQAEQEQPRRTVALKVIKSVWASPELVRRFEQESEALARLQHPGIAQVYEAGAADTESGPQPYFAMEFIHGQTLCEYAAAHHLSTRARLEIMVRICDAVQHAHQRGIIHRDLKPGNILVDETGQPKILDFGVARITDADAHATRQTDLGQLIGTLAYMSPEQVLADPLELDTRSDVYALGVILYELLADRLPYTLSHKLHEALQTIREADPAPLSSISRNYRGDIETIVAKALEKDKTRRYNSAADLAADIRHYLDEEPIAARRPSTAYQLQKFGRRNRALVAGVAAVFVVLVAGIVASTWQAVRANRAGQSALVERDRALAAETKARAAEQATVIERDRALNAEKIATNERNNALAAQRQAVQARNRAVSEQQRANNEAATAKAVSDFLQKDLLAQASANNQAGPNTKPDPDLKVRAALDRAARRIQGKFEKQPLVEAAIRQTIANTYKDLGLYPDAQPHLERAVELRTREQGPEHPDTLTAMSDLADLYLDQGKFAAALALQTRVLQSRRRILGLEHPATLLSLGSVAIVYEKQGQWSQADAIQSQALEISQRVLGEEHSDTLQAMVGLAIIRFRERQLPQAEALDAKAVEILTRVHGEEHPETLEAMNNLAQVYYEEGKDAQAERLQSHTLEIRRRVLGEEHPDTLESMNNLAVIYKAEGKYAETEALHSRSWEIRRRVLGDEHPDTLISMNNLAVTYEAEGKYAEAEATLSKNLEIKRRVLGPEHPSGLSTMYNLARVYGEEHKYREANSLYTTLLDILRRTLGPRHNNTMDTMASFSELEVQERNYDEAEPLLRETWNGLKETRPDYWRTYYIQSLLGSVLMRQRKYVDAEPLLLSGYNGLIQHRDTIPLLNKSSRIDAGEWIVELYRAWGRADKATDWASKLAGEKNDVIGPAHN
jgi:eukaryotic-like serine/threonine-protein kinase